MGHSPCFSSTDYQVRLATACIGHGSGWGIWICISFLGGLNNHNVFPHSLEPGNQSQVLAGLVSPEASLLGLQTAAFSLCPHLPFPVWVCIPGSLYVS